MLLVAWLDFSSTVEASWLASVAIIIGIPFLLRWLRTPFPHRGFNLQ
jgi:hypothetical protein